MTLKSIRFSDIDDSPIPEGEYVRVVIVTDGKRYEVDAAKNQVQDLFSVAREVSMRGRPVKKGK